MVRVRVRGRVRGKSDKVRERGSDKVRESKVKLGGRSNKWHRCSQCCSKWL
jgi:hypothetical protein